ncbi:MAG: leucyl aminopeptidase, partial [Anaerolineae bacterium]|nr:leucyl aminopeptidase [Anaerolineae bacterium]
MDIKAVAGRVESVAADAVIVNLFEDAELSGATATLDTALDSMISNLIEDGDFSGKSGQVAVLYTR